MKRFLSLLLCSAICAGLLSGCNFNISEVLKDNAAEFAEGRDIGEPVLLGLDEAMLEKIAQYSGSLYIPDISVSSEEVPVNPDDPTFTVSCEDDMMKALAEAYANVYESVNLQFEDGYLADHTDNEKKIVLYQLDKQVRRADPLNASNMHTLSLTGKVLEIKYYCSKGMVEDRNAETAELVKKKADEIRKEANTEYEMLLAVNRLLCDEVTYKKSGKHVVHTPYGALKNGEAVCDGYATAAMLILRELGIECDFMMGWGSPMNTKNPTDDRLHAWNLVRINNRWYQLDITWNDEVGDFYQYFLVADSYMAATHKWDPSKYPETPWQRYHP